MALILVGGFLGDEYDRSKLFVAGDELGKILELIAAKDKLGAFVYALVDKSERDKVESVFQKIKEYEHNEAYGKWIMISGIMELLVFLTEIVRVDKRMISRRGLLNAVAVRIYYVHFFTFLQVNTFFV